MMTHGPVLGVQVTGTHSTIRYVFGDDRRVFAAIQCCPYHVYSYCVVVVACRTPERCLVWV